MTENKFCDISNYQPSTDTYIKAIADWGAKAVVVKVTEGTYFIDSTASAKIPLIKKYNMLVHAYHFFHASNTSEAKQEAQYFSNQAEKLGLDKSSTIMVLDVEASDLPTSASSLTACCNAFYEELKSLGWQKQDTYASASWFQNRLVQSDLIANNFWCASYGAKPDKNFNVKYNAWQYCADPAYGSANYIAGTPTDSNIDYNGYYTTETTTDTSTSEEIPAPETPQTSEELEELFKKILENDTLKKTTKEYCTSILNYLSQGNVYDKPPWL